MCLLCYIVSSICYVIKYQYVVVSFYYVVTGGRGLATIIQYAVVFLAMLLTPLLCYYCCYRGRGLATIFCCFRLLCC